MANVHFTLQGKGGVGKSFVSSVMIQYLLKHGHQVASIDTDPVNATLHGYKEFKVMNLNIMDGDNVDARKFDQVMNMIFDLKSDQQHVVIDNGASSFIPLMSYLKENNALQLLQGEGHKVYMHTVITGGQAMLDTLNGLKALCVNFPQVPIVVWLNLYFGEIANNGMSFSEFQIIKRYQEQFHAVIPIPNMNEATFGKDVSELLARKETFDAGINSSLGLMVRQRLKTYWGALEKAISDSGFFKPLVPGE
ncbi:MAG: conjugal transfer protein TraL [Deltaproteobacteria bacterium]|jgi:hypothetical protein|nr:conjugal transfer protein TraL [Deltaproteobacteria bacterium]